MAEAAGNINIVLSVNKANYTAAMQEAQRQLDVFSGKTKAAGAATVSSMVAGSSAVKELSGHWENNTRGAVKFLSTLPGVGKALQAAFPLIGGLAFAGLIAGIGEKVVDFIRKVNAMPKALADGFTAMNLAQTSSNDAMRIANDRLDDQIAKLEHRPQNVVKDELDEARKKADDLAESLGKDSKAFAELMKANSNGIAEQLIGKASTKDVQDQINSYWTEMARLANQKVIALHAGDQKSADAIQTHMDTFTAGEKTRLASDVTARSGNVSLPGGQGATYAQVYGDQSLNITAEQASQARIAGNEDTASLAKANETGTGKLKGLQDAKDATAQAKKAAEQATAAQMKAYDAGLAKLRQAHRVGVSEEIDYWKNIIDCSVVAATNYQTIYDKIGQLNQQKIADDKKTADYAAESIKKQTDAYARMAAAQIEAQQKMADSSAVLADAQGKLSEAQQKNAITSREQITAHDLSTGAISKYTAATQEASEHADAFQNMLDKLAADKKTNDAKIAAENDAYNKRKNESYDASAHGGMTYTDYQNQLATEHQTTLNTLNAKGTDVDAQTANVQGEAALTAQEDKWKAQQETLVGGFDSAIHEFIASSKDAAEQMRSLVTTTLHSLNEQLINGMMGKGTNFKQFGSDVFKNVANTSLQKGEGALMGMIPGMGKMGTKSNPMHVIMDGAGAAGKAAGAIAGAVGGATTAATSKVGSVFGSMLSSILPMLADGGFMNGPAIVGENGPELFNPSVPGQIIPNYKLNTGSGSGDIHFHPGAIDARGSSDPAAVEAAVQRGIRAAAPHIMAGSVHANRETQKRRPSRAA
jgi:hypothetical protein